MTDYVITGSESRAYLLTSDDTLLLERHASLISADTSAIVSNGGNLLKIRGLARSSATENSIGNGVAVVGGSAMVAVGVFGRIVSDHQIGILAYGDLSLVNAGHVQGQAAGIETLSAFARITNSGSILGTEFPGIISYAMNFWLSNSGTIAGNGGIELDGYDTAVIRNAGLIDGGDTAISVSSSNYAPLRIVNTGELVGTVWLGQGSDFFNGTLGSQSVVYGSGGEDRLLGGATEEILFGGTGADVISGGAGYDILEGDDGNDRLWGGEGDDDLVGGRDRDTFKFTPGDGTDTIVDFWAGFDLLNLRQFKFASASEAMGFASIAGADVVFQFAGGETLTLKGNAARFNDINDWLII